MQLIEITQISFGANITLWLLILTADKSSKRWTRGTGLLAACLHVFPIAYAWKKINDKKSSSKC